MVLKFNWVHTPCALEELSEITREETIQMKKNKELKNTSLSQTCHEPLLSNLETLLQKLFCACDETEVDSFKNLTL